MSVSFRRLVGGASALFGLVAAAVGLAPVAQADTVTESGAPPLRFVSYNICGSGMNLDCPHPDAVTDQARYDAVTSQAEATGWKADQIFLQEVCRYQYDAILAKLKPKGFDGHYVSTLDQPGTAGMCETSSSATDGDYGMAVLVKGPVSQRETLELTVGGEKEPIRSPCVKNYVQNRVNWACSVHLNWDRDSTYREREAEKLAAQAKSWQDAGIPVVLGGDFNGQPRSKMASYFYEPGIDDGGWGTFIEADETDRDYFSDWEKAQCSDGRTRCRSGEATLNSSKIDYIFLSARHFKDAKADVLPQFTSASDHRLIRGAATWADCGPSAGTTDGLFRRDASGALFRYAGRADGTLAGACKVGYGWGIMKHVVQDGTSLVAADTDGALWRYPADATGAYSGSTRVRIGTGTSNYNALLAPGDIDGNGTSDLLGRDAAGALWLRDGETETRVAGGVAWQAYDVLIAPGDFSGDGLPDLIGRDATGLLWLHKGDGAGSFGPAVQIGNGWQTYTALVAPGDLDGDGKADLIGRDATGGVWYYKGDGASYYAPRAQVGYSYPQGELLF